MSFADRYGPRTLILGASEGAGRAFARKSDAVVEMSRKFAMSSRTAPVRTVVDPRRM